MKDIVNCATWRLRIKHTFCYTAIVSEPLELLFEQKYSIQPRFYLLRQYSKTSIRTALQRTHAKGIHDTCTGSLFYTNHMHLQNIYVFSNHTIYMLSMQLDDFLCPLLYIHRYILALSSICLCITNLQHFPMALYYSSFLTLYCPIGNFFWMSLISQKILAIPSVSDSMKSGENQPGGAE